ncbi:MAG: glycosyltransferase family 4 protein [Gammaproteobacteria bacterium]|nr:glycosyltransferase family 4 protein [Gammaproteobacteria bacterium]MDH3464310.1 glycosyltransferase family 4 protein [Gammaproteobacteria bacterium]
MSRYASNLIAQFAANPGKDTFEVLSHSSGIHEFMPSAECMTAVSVPEWLRNPMLNIAWHQLALPAVCGRRRFDVLFLPAASRRTPVRVPCPTVGTVHDLTPFHMAGKYDHARMFYQTRVLPLLLKRLTRIIAISESTKRDLLEYVGVPEHRVAVVHSAADTDMFYPRNRDAAVNRVRGYGVRAPYVIYVSRIEHPGKNHVRLIRAFESIKASDAIPHQLVLAGADWVRADEVRHAASESPVHDHILFTGYVHGRDLPDLYCGADVLVFPSLFEGFGLPILEAMACGVPVACSNVSSMPEIAGDAAVLFDPLDVDSIAQGLLALLASEDEHASFVRKGLYRASQFSWEKTAMQTLDVIRGAAKR